MSFGARRQLPSTIDQLPESQFSDLGTAESDSASYPIFGY